MNDLYLVEYTKADIAVCPRCQLCHPQLTIYRDTSPVVGPWLASCPITNVPFTTTWSEDEKH